MGFLNLVEKFNLVNIESVGFGNNKKRIKEEDCIKKLNSIFSIVAECLINNWQIDEKVPKEIVKFIHQDIDHDISVLQRKMQLQIDRARRESNIDKIKFINSNGANFHSAFEAAVSGLPFDCNFRYQQQEIEKEFSIKQQQLFTDMVKEYQNGTRLNDTDFNKLRSYFKDDKHIEECYTTLTKSP